MALKIELTDCGFFGENEDDLYFTGICLMSCSPTTSPVVVMREEAVSATNRFPGMPEVDPG
jgi:hypothetical protein